MDDDTPAMLARDEMLPNTRSRDSIARYPVYKERPAVIASTLEELASFHRFLTARLQSQTSPEDCLLEWRSSQADREATLAAVREGLSDVAAGRVQSLAEFDREFRERHDLARES